MCQLFRFSYWDVSYISGIMLKRLLSISYMGAKNIQLTKTFLSSDLLQPKQQKNKTNRLDFTCLL